MITKQHLISEIEKKLIDNGEPEKVIDLFNFPFDDYNELKIRIKSKDYSFGSRYTSELPKVIAFKSEYMVQLFWSTLPVLIVFVDILFSIFMNDYFLLLGILFAALGTIFSAPSLPIKFLLCFSAFAFIYSLMYLDLNWSIFIGSLFFSQSFLMIARSQYVKIVEDRALNSEIIFCYMYKYKYINIKEKSSNITLNK
jgi:hypothetical protein